MGEDFSEGEEGVRKHNKKMSAVRRRFKEEETTECSSGEPVKTGRTGELQKEDWRKVIHYDTSRRGRREAIQGMEKAEDNRHPEPHLPHELRYRGGGEIF